MKRLFLYLISFLFLLFTSDAGFTQPPLKVGALIPFSGQWGDSGRECAKGLLDAGKWINQQGGVFGRKLEIILIEDTFHAAESLAAYRKLNESDHILLLYVYSTDTGVALLPQSHYHRIPTVISFLPSSYTQPSKHPYAFTITPTPLDLMKIAMKFVSEGSGIKGRKPKMVSLGSSDPIGRDGLQEAADYGRGLGLDVGPDLLVPGSSLSPDRTLENPPAAFPMILQNNPDFTYVNLSQREAYLLLQKAKDIGLKTKWICNMRAFDESLSPFDGVFGIQPVAPYGEGVPGMSGIKEAHQRWHPYDFHTLSYVEGWATAQVIAEALGRALPEQRLSREWVKMALEGLRDFVVGGLVPPVTITSGDHRPSVESRVFVIKEGKVSRSTGFISVGRERK